MNYEVIIGYICVIFTKKQFKLLDPEVVKPLETLVLLVANFFKQISNVYEKLCVYYDFILVICLLNNNCILVILQHHSQNLRIFLQCGSNIHLYNTYSVFYYLT